MIPIKLQSNFIEITLRHGCSPVNLLHICRTPFTKNTSERLLLNVPRFLLKSESESNCYKFKNIYYEKKNYGAMLITKLSKLSIRCYQGGINKKEIQLNLCSILSILMFNVLFICLMTLNRVNLGRTATFMKYLVSVVSLIFLSEILI